MQSDRKKGLLVLPNEGLRSTRVDVGVSDITRGGCYSGR